MAYAKYSEELDMMILEYAEDEKFKSYSQAFRQLIEDIGMPFRLKQITSRYNKLVNNEPIKNYPESDPGDPPTVRTNSNCGRKEGEYGEYSKKSYDPSLSEGQQMQQSADIKEEVKSINNSSMRKTILVVYSNKKNLSAREIRGMKKYSFNTTSDIEEGDVIESDAYDTRMVVTDVLDESFKYYNRATGKLSNTFTSTEERELADLVIREDDVDTVYGSLIKFTKEDES